MLATVEQLNARPDIDGILVQLPLPSQVDTKRILLAMLAMSARENGITTMWLTFKHNCSAIIQSSWLDPRKVREMTIVGSRRMIVYDDVAQLEKIKVFDMRVETPPHYDTFADFHYAYHYGDMYVPYLRQEEPLKIECQHFLDCINRQIPPLSGGRQGLELVRILEASSQSLKQAGAAVSLGKGSKGSSKPNGSVITDGTRQKTAASQKGRTRS